MQCPRCHLENPASTETCDCGYSFVTGSYVPKPSTRSGASSVSGGQRGRYSALEGISRFYRIAAWLVAAVLVVAGIVLFVESTDQQKGVMIPTAIGCFIAAAVQWLVFTAVAEAIALFVDVANDVRAIAIKINSSDGR